MRGSGKKKKQKPTADRTEKKKKKTETRERECGDNKEGGGEKKNTMVQRSLETLSHRRCLSSLVEKEPSSFLVFPFFNSCLLVHTHTCTRIRIRGGFIRICFLFFFFLNRGEQKKKKAAKKNQESKNGKAGGKLKKKIINNHQTKTCLCSLSLRPLPLSNKSSNIYISEQR